MAKNIFDSSDLAINYSRIRPASPVCKHLNITYEVSCRKIRPSVKFLIDESPFVKNARCADCGKLLPEYTKVIEQYYER